MNEFFGEMNNSVVGTKAKDPSIPEGMWIKCTKCGSIILSDDLTRNQKVCEKCGYHFRITARERIALTVDEGSFQEMDAFACGNDPLHFPGYEQKLQSLRAALNMQEAVMCGQAKIGGIPAMICAMDSFFLMGSMGMAVGEKITRAVEYAVIKKLPLVLFTTSGGARMQEGIISLMQMAKTSGALLKLHQAGLLYLSVITDPTTGGVTASFASLGDIILAEPEALIGFAGKRVIEQTIKQTLPEEFQTSEFMLEKGFIDAIVPRKHMRSTLIQLLKLHGGVSQ